MFTISKRLLDMKIQEGQPTEWCIKNLHWRSFSVQAHISELKYLILGQKLFHLDFFAQKGHIYSSKYLFLYDSEV